MKQAMLWVDKEQAIKQVPCTCIDGRTKGLRYSAAGGSFGIAIWLLSVAERLLGRQLTKNEIEASLIGFVVKVAPLYLHTDQHAIDLIYARMGLSDDIQLIELSGQQQAMFICLAKKADFQGCGHIKLMLAESQKYGVRDELVELGLDRFLTLFFAKVEGVYFDVLAGRHEEERVVLFEESAVDEKGVRQEYVEKTPLFQALGDESFFCHRPLKQELIKRFYLVLKELFDLPDGDYQDLTKQHDKAAEVTIGFLAPSLPIEQIRI